MYKTRFELPLKDFIAAQEIPEADEIRVIRCVCDDDGEPIKADAVYTGKAGDVPPGIGEMTIDAVNSDFWRNQSGYWHIETPPLYASEQAAA